MVRMLLLGLVVVLSTLGGSYAAMKIPQVTASAKEAAEESVSIVKLDPVSVPVVREGKIQGYVLGRISFSTSAAEAARNKDALVLYVNEAIFRSIYEEETLDFTSLKPVGVEALVGRVVEKANARIGRTAIVQVFVENLNFLAHEAVRCQTVK